jgi:cytochrome o ubiquinol oxidase operon protein cyoD
MEWSIMSEIKNPQISHFEPPHGSLQSYVIGFTSCLILSLLAYAVAVSQSISNVSAILIIGALAIVQFFIQLTRFLHLDSEFKPRWKLAVFILMLTIVLIVVIGSLWIMSNLNYNMLDNQNEINKYVQSQDGL